MDRTSGLMTTRELAGWLRVTPQTVRDWSRTGRIPFVRVSPKVVRYELSAVLAAISSCKPEGVSHDK